MSYFIFGISSPCSNFKASTQTQKKNLHAKSRVLLLAPSQLAHPSAPYFLTSALKPPLSPTPKQQREGTLVEHVAAFELGLEEWALVEMEGENVPERGGNMNSFIKYLLSIYSVPDINVIMIKSMGFWRRYYLSSNPTSATCWLYLWAHPTPPVSRSALCSQPFL